MKKKAVPIGALLTALILPIAFPNIYLIKVLTIMLIFIMYSSAWNLLAYSGQASLGHAAFFGIGAYASALFANKLPIHPIFSSLIAGIIAALVGLAVGIVCLRLREWFLAMVTFGVPLIIQTLTVTKLKFLGGWDGMPARRLVTPTQISYLYEYYLILAVCVISILIISMIFNSKFGIALSVIRQNEAEAKILGINVVRYKLIAFLLSSYLAGVAGALEVHHIGYITPEVYGSDISFWPVVYTIAGGLGTIEGPVIGTVVITFLWELLKNLGLLFEKYIIIGIMLVGMVIFMPRGLVSLVKKRSHS